jgi:hypothetical protein
MADFQVGDKVKVREDLTAGVRYNEYRCNEEMEELRGKICTIRNISNSSGVYNIVEDKSSWFWTDDMFEPVTKSTKEDKTISNFNVGDKVRVRHGLVYGKNYNGIYCNEIMSRMCGEVLTIKCINTCSYNVKENYWVWSEEMLEPVNKNTKENKTYDMFDTSTIVNTKENNNMNMRKVCYEIVDYKYNTETGETYIKWDDKSETRVRPESDTEPDQFVGFVTAYAKKAAGNTGRINSFFTQWAIKKPKLDAEEKAKKKAAKAEAKRIVEKRKAKKEKWLVRKAALRIKREYEAAQLAHEEYGVPIKIEGTKLKKKSK